MPKTPRDCDQCGRVYEAWPSEVARGRRYCSKSCARTALNLTEANPALHRDITGERNPMFGQRPTFTPFGGRGPLAPRWKGGRKTHAAGYAMVWTPRGYVLEHRLVMEEHLGRPLAPEEIVHHLDHDKTNNAVENLRVMTQAEHASLHAG